MFYGRDWEGVGLEELGEKDRWLHRVVQHKEDQALAGLDEPLGIQAEPSPCSLARTVRKSGTTPLCSNHLDKTHSPFYPRQQPSRRRPSAHMCTSRTCRPWPAAPRSRAPDMSTVIDSRYPWERKERARRPDKSKSSTARLLAPGACFTLGSMHIRMPPVSFCPRNGRHFKTPDHPEKHRKQSINNWNHLVEHSPELDIKRINAVISSG